MSVVMTTSNRAEAFLLYGWWIFVKRLEADVILTKEALIASETVQQFSLRKPAASLAGA